MRSSVILGGLCLTLFSGTTAALPEGFAESLTVSQSERYRGELVVIDYRVCNISEQALQPCSIRCDVSVSIFGANGTEVASTRPGGCNASCSLHEWQPGECAEARYEWPQTGGEPGSGLEAGEQVPPGRYYARMGHGSNALFTGTFELFHFIRPVPVLSSLAAVLLAFLLAMVGWRAARG